MTRNWNKSKEQVKQEYKDRVYSLAICLYKDSIEMKMVLLPMYDTDPDFVNDVYNRILELQDNNNWPYYD
jgi:hypothetical protein